MHVWGEIITNMHTLVLHTYLHEHRHIYTHSLVGGREHEGGGEMIERVGITFNKEEPCNAIRDLFCKIQRSICNTRNQISTQPIQQGGVATHAMIMS